jgi:magnesium-transporting ATPase (P-type)
MLVGPVLAQTPGASGGSAGEKVDIFPNQDKWQGLATLSISQIVSGLISFALIVAAVVFFFMLVWGGLKWITSQGDENKVKEARAQVTQALIGLAVVFAAWAILSLVATLFLGPGASLQNLTIPSFK